jgi:dihydroflavonol-4-reductase
MVAIPLDFSCRALVYPLTFGAETMARVTRRELCLSIDGLRMPKHVMFFRSAKAKRDLGYKAQSYSEALKEALVWFRGTGQLR